MHFHVLGSGSIGSLISYHLRRALPSEHTITIIRRTRQLTVRTPEAINIEHNGTVTTQTGFRSEIFEGWCPPNSEEPQQQGTQPIDSLIVATKAYQCVGALRRLLPRLSAKSTIVLLHNGMGVYEEIVRNVFRNPEQQPHFILASVTHGVFRKKMSHYVHAGIGEINFGIVPDRSGRRFEAGFEDLNIAAEERQPRLSDITPGTDDPLFEKYASLRNTVAALLRMSDLNVSWKPITEAQIMMRRKLVANTVINPLTALMGCRNGEIFEGEASKRILRKVCKEASFVFAAEIEAEFEVWKEIIADKGANIDNLMIRELPQGLTWASLEEEVLRVAQATRGNISSMLTDIRLGRPTEIEFMNGYLLKMGKTYRVPMPVTAALQDLVLMRSVIPIDQILDVTA